MYYSIVRSSANRSEKTPFLLLMLCQTSWGAATVLIGALIGTRRLVRTLHTFFMQISACRFPKVEMRAQLLKQRRRRVQIKGSAAQRSDTRSACCWRQDSATASCSHLIEVSCLFVVHAFPSATAMQYLDGDVFFASWCVRIGKRRGERGIHAIGAELLIALLFAG